MVLFTHVVKLCEKGAADKNALKNTTCKHALNPRFAWSDDFYLETGVFISLTGAILSTFVLCGFCEYTSGWKISTRTVIFVASLQPHLPSILNNQHFRSKFQQIQKIKNYPEMKDTPKHSLFYERLNFFWKDCSEPSEFETFVSFWLVVLIDGESSHRTVASGAWYREGGGVRIL